MIVKIDAFTIVEKLKKGDIVFQQKENEKYIISSLNAEQVMLVLAGGGINIKLLPIRELINDGWYLESNRQHA